MTEILKEILKDLPDGKISDANFEGANIVLYTKDKDFFLDDKNMVKDIVNKIKKRIELRPDPSICMDEEKAEKKIRKAIGEDAGIDKIIFDPQRSMVIIEVEKPGTAIGKQGDTLQKIKSETLWVPTIRRKPAIRSQLIENIRSVLYQNSDYRKKFLHKTGERIYNGWMRGKKDEWVRITALGGARQVGRSAILLQTPESRVLLDCGIDVASEKNPYPHLEAPEFDIKELDAIIVSHAHIDHSGLVPLLFKYGYRGPVYCTRPTRDISALLQLDLIKIQREEGGKDPIYSSDDVKETVKHTITLEYGEVTDITPDIRITLYNAGHILGSAMVHIHIGNGLHNFLYSADIKYAKTNLLSPAHTTFPRLETLMIESTYGSKDAVMPNPRDQDKLFGDIVTNTLKRGGKVLMPVLGSGRAQEIIVLIERMIREGMMDKIPIYIDGLVWDITAIHTAYPEYLNSNVREQIFHKDNNPFLQDNIKRIGSAQERKELLEETGPCVILATSGMLVGGPSVAYLRELANNPKNSLVFTCYQGEGSLGRIIQQGVKEVNFKNGSKNELVEIKLEVHKLEITGHSDRRELMNFIGKCNPKPRKVIVNHGESSRCLDLARSVHKTHHVETLAPKNLESIRLV
ncbi:MAG: beta-CASP ribonuclease aCPSF1 [Nanoarchaeota archaeon]|nr:beta-CASP ribonuclease aCPSF1 [Nanoarchaeota archaeon]MBU1270251.1 beta-CASP ribonuclease aCPSF1 [Nanoarchaeota archaeon]MBU1604835.1 beta-CASP ribonuclease aCPSF1 [Nanoarchaeota archaeon]MBU2442495.1 beta-CASP ribonuclease aCPSF1 [Nanoarchaeota archaeon]